jgi:hypothetical protein
MAAALAISPSRNEPLRGSLPPRFCLSSSAFLGFYEEKNDPRL